MSEKISNPAEAQLEALFLASWRRFFDNSTIRATDNFFECGGNSLLAARLATLLTAQLDTVLTPADILAYPSARSLAGKFSGSRTVSQKIETGERASRQRIAFARKPALARSR